jgi:hypothetical protein
VIRSQFGNAFNSEPRCDADRLTSVSVFAGVVHPWRRAVGDFSWFCLALGRFRTARIQKDRNSLSAALQLGRHLLVSHRSIGEETFEGGVIAFEMLEKFGATGSRRGPWRACRTAAAFLVATDDEDTAWSGFRGNGVGLPCTSATAAYCAPLQHLRAGRGRGKRCEDRTVLHGYHAAQLVRDHNRAVRGGSGVRLIADAGCRRDRPPVEQ